MSESGIKIEIDFIQYLRQHPENKDNPQHQSGIDLAEMVLERFHVAGLHLQSDFLLKTTAKPETISPSDRFSGTPSDLATRIFADRHLLGWSQRRLAEIAHVSHGYVALLELKRLKKPSKENLDRILGALENARRESQGS